MVRGRRLVFATPLVVVVPACAGPSEPRERRQRPVPVAIADAGVDAAVTPEELVDALPPLSKDRTMEDVCRRALCNPPPPWPPSYDQPAAVGTVATEVSAIQREPTGSRVRAHRSDRRIDETWQATFVTEAQAPVADCTIVAWSYDEIECTTVLAPEQLVEGRETMRLHVTPPPALVEKIEQQRAAWRPRSSPPPEPPPGWPGAKKARIPTGNPPPPIARILDITVRDAGVEVTFDRGNRDGVTRQWRARLVQKTGKPLPNGDCQIVQISERRSSCIAKVTVDQARLMRLRIEP